MAVVSGAAVGAQASPSGPASSASGSIVPAGSSTANDPHEAAAQREAVRMLAAFQAPPGATLAANQPDPLPSGLDRPPMKSAAESQVASVGWYETSQSPDDVLAWVKAHPPTGSALSGGGSGSGPGFVTFSFPGPGRANWLIVTPQSAADGRTIIRLDASAVWTPSRPSGSTLGYTATSVSVVTVNPMNPQFALPADETATHTSTDPAVVHQVVDLLNALQPPVPGTKNCAADMGITVRITLPGLATAAAQAGGCGEVVITPQGGAPEYYDGAADLIPKVYTLFGVTWSRSTGLPPGIARTGAAGTR
ncbi:hypothetical protein ABH935_003304 [Catenulispora sp. GAS73]|uniref:hypothetical protein n=1 Tax=Catenulispora sp. GAS73 TaxID=3156269 RepID=UPI0035132EA3